MAGRPVSRWHRGRGGRVGWPGRTDLRLATSWSASGARLVARLFSTAMAARGSSVAPARVSMKQPAVSAVVDERDWLA